jgi:hypothetical protein
MPELPNISDQFGLIVEIVEATAADWINVRLALYRYDQKSNVSEPWVQVTVETYEGDLRRLKKLLEDFASASDASNNFAFEPQVEPTFLLSLERIPHNGDFCRVANLAIDLKCIFHVSVPTAYREDRIALRFHTTEQRMQSFIADLTKQIGTCIQQTAVPGQASSTTTTR